MQRGYHAASNDALEALTAGDRIIGAEGTGFRTALATLDHTRITSFASDVAMEVTTGQ